MMTLLKIKHHKSTANHPESNSKTKRINMILEKYLRVYYNYQQNNCTELLLLTEFEYNNILLAGIGSTSFFPKYKYYLY